MSLPRRARCVVIGTGAFGSAAAWQLARRLGDEVVVLEQFAPGHTRGSSEDHSRIVRHSYASATYTALTPAAFAAWEAVEAAAGRALVVRTGGLDIADPAVAGSESAVEGIACALSAVGRPFERLGAAAVMARWPQWRLPDDAWAVAQAEAGILDIGAACAVQLALARAAGARVMPGVRVSALEPSGGHVDVVTPVGTITAEHVVCCAGKWTNAVLGDVASLPLTYTREQVTYFRPPDLAPFAPERFPVWIRWGDPCFYGLGLHGLPAIKAAEDMGGPQVEVDDLESPTDPVREERVAAFLRACLPGALGPVSHSRACLYELPPGRDLVLGPLPQAPRISVAIGAGHGAKFAALVGSVLCDLALDGETPHPVEALRPDRVGPAAAPPA